jgi:hypothetical protein
MATRQVEVSTKEHTAIRSARVGWQPVVASALLLAFVFFATAARGEEPRVQPGGVTAPEHGDVADASYLNLLYFLFYNLPNAWQIGFNPTITYDHRASSGNKWNVPVGLLVSKTTRMGGMMAKFELGIEYSVVSQDAFGQRAMIKLDVIPVIPSLIREPLFGGR